MAKIDFSFGGWARGVEVTTVEVVETGEKLDVSDVPAAELIEKLEISEWCISLDDALTSAHKAEVKMFDFSEEGKWQ